MAHYLRLIPWGFAVGAYGTVVHIYMGNFHRGSRRTIALSIGVVLGAQRGAWLATRIHGRWILRGLALCLPGIRLLFPASGALP